MARTPQDVTDAELAVLQVLWEEGPLPIRSLADVLYPGGKTAQYATVQKLLERLEGKGCVARAIATWRCMCFPPPSTVTSWWADGSGWSRKSSAAAPGRRCSRTWCRPSNSAARNVRRLRQLIDDLDQPPARKDRHRKEQP